MKWRVVAILALSATYMFTRLQADEGKYSIRPTEDTAPKELDASIHKLLTKSGVQLFDGDKLVCEVWLREEVPADANAEQIKTGVTYREVKQTEILGAVKFHKEWSDYRKQKVPAGVYTMRLAYILTDGKHTADVSEFQDFVALLSAKSDKSPGLLEPKALYEISGESIGSGHPAIFMLNPNNKAADMPQLVARPKDHWSLQSRSKLLVAGKDTGTHLGLGINLVGHSPAE